MGYDMMTEFDSANDLYFQGLEEMMAEQEQAIPVAEEIACCLDDDDIPF